MKIHTLFKILVATFILGAFPATLQANMEVDIEKTTFKWNATKSVGEGHWGYIYLNSAEVKLENGKIVNAEFSMDMNSFTVDNLSGEWKDKFIGHVKSSDFFDVTKYPTAKLVLNKQIDEDSITGVLTIKGKSNPVNLKFEKNENQFSGVLKFDRTKFGIKYGSENFFKELVADKIIGDEVTVAFTVVLK